MTLTETSATFPLVKLERKARGEFYVFLAMDSDALFEIPVNLRRLLDTQRLRFADWPPLTPEEIKGMAAQQNIEIHGFNSLRYRVQSIQDPGDPFAPPDVWRPPPTASPETNAAHERLLYWISARGEGTWAQFRDAAQTLGVAEDRQAARSAIRRLILLGHLDRSDDGERWSASPAALVRLADDPDTVYLAGARVPSLLSGFALRETEQIHDAGPPRWDADAGILENADTMDALGIADAGATSALLADILPDIDGWKDTLKAVGIIPATFNIVERWDGGEFRLCDTLHKRNDGRLIGESGMYRFSRQSDPTGRTPTEFFDEPSQKFLRGDWYGLRFLSVESPSAVYDAENGALLIPDSQRWPLLYERALTLASGLLPDRADNAAWLLRYPNLPRSIAETLCRKLNVNLTEK